MQRILTDKTPQHTGETVRVAGWVHARRDHGKLIFIDLRDRRGLLQVVFSGDIGTEANALRPEWVVAIEGTVAARPDNMVNEDIPTGTVELKAEKLTILNPAETPALEVANDGRDVGEEVRLTHRFVDLRRERMQNNLRARHRMSGFVRAFLSEKDFTEIETPILTRSTPEGARDFIVPSRQHPGQFYALPQSPQQYKQLLMAAGFERYFQFARALRDEDTRGDRQPEHTQIDMELSFTTPEEILGLVEELMIALVEKHYPEKHITRTPFPRITYTEAMETYDSDRPDMRENSDDPNELAFAFVTDFPMFEKRDDGSLGAVHHPFTKVRDEDITGSDPLSLTAEQYDLVLNGEEVGGGSIREHNAERLSDVFSVLGHTQDAIANQFGHLMRAFRSGIPPHGGIAIGFDRLMMVLQNEPNIREVIAFPKTGDGRDLLMNTPADISEAQLKELGLTIQKDKKKKE